MVKILKGVVKSAEEERKLVERRWMEYGFR
jgi:hypothetical protein